MSTLRTVSLNVRMTADEYSVVEARAERLGISISQALRELLSIAATMELGEQNGWNVSDGVQAMIARREPLILAIAPDPDDPRGGPLWLVTPEEVQAHEAGAL